MTSLGPFGLRCSCSTKQASSGIGEAEPHFLSQGGEGSCGRVPKHSVDQIVATRRPSQRKTTSSDLEPRISFLQSYRGVIHAQTHAHERSPSRSEVCASFSGRISLFDSDLRLRSSVPASERSSLLARGTSSSLAFCSGQQIPIPFFDAGCLRVRCKEDEERENLSTSVRFDFMRRFRFRVRTGSTRRRFLPDLAFNLTTSSEPALTKGF
jgi:hypothetical protein